MGLGAAAGRRANEAASGLPAHLLVGVSGTAVYGAAEPRHHQPGQVLFAVPRAGLTAKVHQRVNVRVLELIDEATDTRIELEGQPDPAHARQGRDARPVGGQPHLTGVDDNTGAGGANVWEHTSFLQFWPDGAFTPLLGVLSLRTRCVLCCVSSIGPRSFSRNTRPGHSPWSFSPPTPQV